MADIDAIKRRFAEEIKLRGYDDKYIDKNEEREILQIAIQQGITIDSARGALATACEHHGYVLESAVLRKVKDDIEAAMSDDGKIDKKEFDMIFASAKKAMAGKKNDIQIKKMMVEMREETGMPKVKKGWFSNWYADLKKGRGIKT